METTAAEKARILTHDLGIDAGIRYARKISQSAETNGHTEMSKSYAEAADILERRREASSLQREG